MTTKPFEFEKALKELEEITGWFESTNVDLDQGIAKFERGMELASELKAHLTSVENRVEKIRARFSAASTEGPIAHIDTDAPDDTSAGSNLQDQADLFGV